MVSAKKISSRSAKDLLLLVSSKEGDPEDIAKKEGLFQADNSSDIDSTVATVIAQNPKVSEEFKAGKDAALEFLVGQSMKALRGAADPNVLREAIRKQILT